jgi:hypothetical protein
LCIGDGVFALGWPELPFVLLPSYPFFSGRAAAENFPGESLLTATARLNLLAPATGHFSDFIYAADPEQELALADPAPVIPTMAKAQGNIRSSRRFIFMSFLL